MKTKPNKVPQRILKKIRAKAPKYVIDEPFGRRISYHNYMTGHSIGYNSICIYIQSGMAKYKRLFKKIIRLIIKIQESKGKYPVIIFGIGSGKHLNKETAYFTFGFWNDDLSADRVSNKISSISGSTPDGQSTITELFPKTSIKNLYLGKTNINNKDLLIFIAHKDAIFFNTKVKRILNPLLKKNVLVIEKSNSKEEWYFGDYNPNYKGE